MTATICVAVIALFGALATAEILEVPNEYQVPAAAIAASSSGDTVLLHAGVYTGPIIIPDHDLTLAGEYLLTQDTLDIASTVVGPDSANPATRCVETRVAAPGTLLRLIGLKLQAGAAPGSNGGGIAASNRILVIDHCRITKCFARFGGALSAVDCSVRVNNSRIDRNRSQMRYGNILHLLRSSMSLKSCIVGYSVGPPRDGYSDYEMMVDRSSIYFENCTIRNLGWLSEYGSSLFVTERNSVAYRVVLTQCQLLNCRINRAFQINDNSGVHFFAMDSCQIELNQVAQGIYDNNYGDSTFASRFIGNTFSENLYPPMWLGSGLLIFTNGHRPSIVRQNLFINNNVGEESCLFLTNGATVQREFTRNFYFGNTNRALLSPPGGVNAFERLGEDLFFENILDGNIGNAVFQSPWQSPPSHAEHNYWGSPLGPYQSETNPLSDGDSVSSQIIYDPFEPDTSFLAIERDGNRYISGTPDFLIGFAYPNPFNSEVTIEYVLTKDTDTRLTIYNLQGQVVAKLVNSMQRIGVHQAVWNANDRASGIYFAALSSPQSSQQPHVQKLMLLK